MPVVRAPFGKTKEGQAVEKFIMRVGAMECEILTYGAAVRALRVPRGDGTKTDVVLGYDSLSGYEENDAFVGALVGRYANRIANAACILDGETIQLEPSEGVNQLHGGVKGFSYRVFEGEAVGENSVILRYDAADGEGGFPGQLALTCTYTLTGNALRMRYQARTTRPTCCNITNHSYFNLNGGGDVLGHTLRLAAHCYTPVDTASIPREMARPVAATPFDFTTDKLLGQDIDADDEQLHNVGGYDHNFVLDPGQGLRFAARLAVDDLAMEVWTQKPGIQLYSANSLHNSPQGKGGVCYAPRQAVCLETQFFPDSPNHPEWGDITLRPGMRYDYTTEYRFYPL